MFIFGLNLKESTKRNISKPDNYTHCTTEPHIYIYIYIYNNAFNINI